MSDEKSLAGLQLTGHKLLCLVLGDPCLRELGEKQCGGFRGRRARLDP